MRTIYLVRHGEPDFPDGKRLCLGRMELPLGREGKIQAALLHEYFRDKAPMSVFCSPRLRTVQTAQAISQSCTQYNGLREMDMGDWEGLSFPEIRERYPELYRQRGIDPFAMQIPNAEHMRDFRERVLTAFHALLNSVSGDIVIAAHAGVNRIILCEALGFPWEKLYTIRQNYGCVSVLEQDADGLYVREALLEPRPPLSDALCDELVQILGDQETFLKWKSSYVPAESAQTQANASALWRWDSDKIRFMNDAIQYGSYADVLAAHLQSYVNEQDTLCDVGCGLAEISMALAPTVKSVAALDINPDVLAAAEANCTAHGTRNMQFLCADAKTLPETMQFDDMLFCFYGEIDEILQIAAKHCRKQILIVKRNYTSHRFSVGRHLISQSDYACACAYLDSLGIPYAAQTLSVESGQPFRCIEDARQFFALYSKDADPVQLTDVFLTARLTETGNSTFPYYLPQKKELGLFRLNVSDLVK